MFRNMPRDPHISIVTESSFEVVNRRWRHWGWPDAEMSSITHVMSLGRTWRWSKTERHDMNDHGSASMKSLNTFEQIEDDHYQENRKMNIYWPFQSHVEWRLGKFLVENLTQAQINTFLKLDWLEAQKPSFTTALQLLDWMDTLPSGPGWKVMELEVDGYNTEKKIELIFRDGLEVVESLFGNPIFSQNMSFNPLLLWNNVEWEYGEWFTADEASHIQGATIIPIIAASDKTPVTRHTGALEMHPLFLTIANIDSNIHMKATACAWRCIAFVPVIKFEVHPDYQTILQARLWHKCMDIVMEKLKRTANVGEFMTDAFAWMADLPEQQLIASVSRNLSPVTLANLKQFGDSTCYTLDLIHMVSRQVDPWRLDAFQKLAKTSHLLGDWKNSEVSSFLVPEVLHSLHKFFFNHIFMWCKDVAGNDELDARLQNSSQTHQYMPLRLWGIMHDTDDSHDCWCHSPPMVQSVRALIDFIYLAQRPIHMESSIRHMENSLSEFHATKDAILNAGGHRGKDHFNILKLELMLSFVGAIRRSGGLIQYSADVSERLLITHCKTPFTRTNGQSDFTKQIIRLLDCQECMHLMDVYLLLCEHNEPLVNASADEEELLSSNDPTSAWISHVAPSEQCRFNSPRLIHNLFTKGLLSNGTPATLSVTITPDCKKLSTCDIADIYALPDFATQLAEYVAQCTGSMTSQFILQSFNEVVVWYKFHIQQYSISAPSVIMPSQVVQALTPSPDFPLGNCDAVLLNTHEESLHNHGSSTLIGIKVRTVFQLTSSHCSQTTPTFFAHPLLYVQPLNVIATPDNQPDTRLWTLKGSHMGFIIPLTEVVHPADLVPVFGERVNRTVTAATSQQVYDRFYLNYFTTKEAFDTFYDHRFV
ncbi:hypothetical protein BKA83DRAFT_4464486 [Pisolithus microcarpus]|nr:hypothetical protein BKA83DRAFT_4464486 [Pisolithus microcarpus]